MKPSLTTANPQPVTPAVAYYSPSKPNSGTGVGFFPPASFYEPTSVLDPHLHSSSPAGSDPLLDLPSLPPWDSHPPPPPPPSSDDPWDTLSSWLLDKDLIHGAPGGGPVGGGDAAFPLSDPFDFFSPPAAAATLDLESLLPPPPPTFEQAHLDQLLRAAHAAESRDRDVACMILARLNHHLPSPAGTPLQRAAFYFKEALHALLDDDHLHHYLTPPTLLPTPIEVVRKIAAYKALSDLSPVPQFASFSANQTVLEAVFLPDGNGNAAAFRPIHLIDFDIGLGGQWSSFMHEVAARCRVARVPPPPVRITAVVLEESLETTLAAENLRDFAVGLGVRFSIDFVRVAGMGAGALGAVRLAPGDAVAVSFTPAVTRLLGGGGSESVDVFLRFLRRASPRVAVFVDADGAPHGQSFRRSFAAGLEYYSLVLESLYAAATAVGYSEEQVGRIERALVQPRVWAAVRSYDDADGGSPVWKEVLEGAGLKPVPFSEFTESQAHCLTRRAPVGGYYVARRDEALVLSWQRMDLAATSAWRY